jgi:hypothetical protein
MNSLFSLDLDLTQPVADAEKNQAGRGCHAKAKLAQAAKIPTKQVTKELPDPKPEPTQDEVKE